jgi:hypothetical protein
MAKKYTSAFEIYVDVYAYISLRTGSPLSLATVQPIAVYRYPWMVDNWQQLYQQFLTFSNGDSVLLSTLTDFDRAVQSYILGNKNNELSNSTNYEKFYPFLETISIETLSLTPDETILFNKEIDRISDLNLDDFRGMISFMKLAMSTLSEQIGLGDPVAAAYYKKSVNPKRKNATIADMAEIKDYLDLIKIIQGIVFDLQSSQKKAPNLLAISNQNIEAGSEVAFKDSYRSFTTVPFEISLEHMAELYLGSRRRWYELVTINNFKPPYVDFTGEKFKLLAPAAVNNCIISDTRRDDIPVGASVGIGSYKFREETRVIERTIQNEDGTIVLFLSGKQDLNKFITAHEAYIRIFLPGTTRQGVYVKIPSDDESPLNPNTLTPRSGVLRQLDKALLEFGVDIARDEKTNDFVVDANGNFKMAYGMANVRQSVLYALRTVRGELPFHPTYGVNTNIGSAYFGTTDEVLVFGDLLRSTLLRDQRFTDVQISKISATGTSMSLSLLVFIAGANQPIPLSFIS